MPVLTDFTVASFVRHFLFHFELRDDLIVIELRDDLWAESEVVHTDVWTARALLMKGHIVLELRRPRMLISIVRLTIHRA